MSMTRKHFEAIASTLKEVRRQNVQHSSNPGVSNACVDRIAEGLCDQLYQFNPNFDQDRFLEACGVEV